VKFTYFLKNINFYKEDLLEQSMKTEYTYKEILGAITNLAEFMEDGTIASKSYHYIFDPIDFYLTNPNHFVKVDQEDIDRGLAHLTIIDLKIRLNLKK
jgi:hypothetical protein